MNALPRRRILIWIMKIVRIVVLNFASWPLNMKRGKNILRKPFICITKKNKELKEQTEAHTREVGVLKEELSNKDEEVAQSIAKSQ